MYLLDHGVGRGALLVLALAVGSLLVLPAKSTHAGRVVVTDTETTILDVVEFYPGTATLEPSSLPTLDAVAATLIGNPSIELVEVQSHTRADIQAESKEGGDNLSLSQQRAEVIVEYLVHAGVGPERLVAHGYGDSQPIDRAAPAKNERVSFLILKRAPDFEARP